jgi:uncharacterized alpha/beta hydrolase family protein
MEMFVLIVSVLVILLVFIFMILAFRSMLENEKKRKLPKKDSSQTRPIEYGSKNGKRVEVISKIS